MPAAAGSVRRRPAAAEDDDSGEACLGGFRAGDSVSIHSLVKAAEYNGRTGRVDGTDGDRLTVQLPGLDDLLRVRPANLTLVARAGAAGGAEGGFRIGDLVVLGGLESAAHLNGAVGSVKGQDGERYLVQVVERMSSRRGCTISNRTLRVRTSCMFFRWRAALMGHNARAGAVRQGRCLRGWGSLCPALEFPAEQTPRNRRKRDCGHASLVSKG